MTGNFGNVNNSQGSFNLSFNLNSVAKNKAHVENQKAKDISKNDPAASFLASIDYSLLTDENKALYDSLKNKDGGEPLVLKICPNPNKINPKDLVADKDNAAVTQKEQIDTSSKDEEPPLILKIAPSPDYPGNDDPLILKIIPGPGYPGNNG